MESIRRLAGAGRQWTLDPIGALARADARYRTRRRLRELDDWQLHDIGLTRRDIEEVLRRG